MPSVYIAGPMRGIPDFNFPAFDKARDLGVSLGYKVYSPADMDRAAGLNEQTPAQFGPADIRVFATRDIDVLLNKLRAENGDAIALLPGWPTSSGAPAELALAKWLKLEILDALTFKPLDARLQGYEIRNIEAVNPRRFGACVGNSCDANHALIQIALIQIASAIANQK